MSASFHHLDGFQLSQLNSEPLGEGLQAMGWTSQQGHQLYCSPAVVWKTTGAMCSMKFRMLLLSSSTVTSDRFLCVGAAVARSPAPPVKVSLGKTLKTALCMVAHCHQ